MSEAKDLSDHISGVPLVNEIGGKIHYAAAHLDMRTKTADEHHSKVVVRDCRHGKFCYCPHEAYIGKSMEMYGEYSEGEVDLFRALLKPNMVVIEVGANSGTLTVPLAKIVGPGGRVFAFEPQRVVFQQLCANLAMNGIWNVFAEQMCLGVAPGSMGVPAIDYAMPLNFGGVSMVEKAPEMVTMINLDMISAAPHFIKIDVEGMEYEVIQGGKKMIDAVRPVLYVENDRKEKAERLTQSIVDLNYDLYWHTPPLFNPNNFRGNAANAFGEVVSINMLCIPKEMKMRVEGLQRVGVSQ